MSPLLIYDRKLYLTDLYIEKCSIIYNTTETLEINIICLHSTKIMIYQFIVFELYKKFIVSFNTNTKLTLTNLKVI